jgi:hypothetical protein
LPNAGARRSAARADYDQKNSKQQDGDDRNSNTASDLEDKLHGRLPTFLASQRAVGTLHDEIQMAILKGRSPMTMVLGQ